MKREKKTGYALALQTLFLGSIFLINPLGEGENSRQI